MQTPNDHQGFDTSHRRIIRDGLIILAVIVIVVGGALWVMDKASGWLVGLIPPSVDTFIGDTASKTTASTPCSNPALQAYVDELTTPILAELGPQPYSFSFVVVDDEQPNAFALPGGFVTIHSGLIEAADSGEEIAGVLAHEVAHVTHRHGLRRIVRSAGIAIAVGLVFGSTDLAVLADYASDLGHLAYDRDQERQADATARKVLTAANINPRGMAQFFRKLLEDQGNASWIPGFLSTHPDLEERIEESLAAPMPSGALQPLPPPENLRCRPNNENEVADPADSHSTGTQTTSNDAPR